MPNPFVRSRELDTPNAIVGAARRIHLNRRSEVEKLRETNVAEWQNLAWRYYDEIGEIKFGFNYFASISSRVRLFGAYQNDDDESPGAIEDSGVSPSLTLACREEMDKLNRGRGGQPNLIRQLALNLLVAGEAYLVGYAGSFSIRSTSELEVEAGGRIRLITSSRGRSSRHTTYLPEDATVLRIWRTHPRYSDDADSSLRGVLKECGELLLLGRLINASVNSRLNAGILYVADELRFQRADTDQTTPQPDVDPFEEELTLSLTEAIDETDSPSNIIPIIVRGPADLADKAMLKIDLSRDFDETVIQRHEQTLKRVIDGIDVPVDIIKGMANVRYSNAQTISEDMLKAYIEPLIVLICEAFTVGYLRPALMARGFSAEEVAHALVWYDASEVVTRPDRSEDADKGWDRKLISGAAWRRAHGFNEADAPSDEEIAVRVALEATVTPDVTLAFLRQIAPELVAEAERLAAASGQVVTGETENPSDYTPQAPTAQVPPRPTNPQGGQMPPRPVADPAAEAAAARDAQVLSLLSNFAVRKRGANTVSERQKKLTRALEVERRMRDQLFMLLNNTVESALSKAGARTVSKVRGDAEMKSLVSEVPMEAVFAAIPEDRRSEFALNPETLVRDTIEKVHSTYVGLVTQLQETGWRALGVRDEMAEHQADRVERSWTWVRDRLTTLATGWLQSPSDRDGAYVDMDSVRIAQALAGGAGDGENEDATGRAILSADALDQTGWELGDRKQWVYGISENSFEPHLALDGTYFETWADDELSTNAGEFPFTTHYYPGDHNGCRCDWLPELLDPAEVNSDISLAASLRSTA
jgi:hypothetical protein